MKTSLIWVHSATRKELTKLVEILNQKLLIETKSLPHLLCATNKDKIILETKFVENEIYSIEDLFNEFNYSYNKIEKKLTPEEQKHLLNLSTYSFFQKPFIDYKISSIKTGSRTNINIDVLSEYLIIKSFLKLFILKVELNLICCLNPNSVVGAVLKFLSKELNNDIFYWEKGLEPNSVIVDNDGVNYGSNISEQLYQLSHKKEVTIKTIEKFIPICKENKAKILISLQVENDTNIKIYSEINSMFTFLRVIELILGKRNDLEVIVRKHPRENLNEDQKMIIKKNKWVISEKKLFSEDIKRADYIFVVNSTTGYESIKMNKFTFMFGDSIYSNIFNKNFIKKENIDIKFYKYDPNSYEDNNLRIKLLEFVNQNSIFYDKEQDYELLNLKRSDSNEKERYVNSFLISNNNTELIYKSEVNKRRKFFVIKKRISDKIESFKKSLKKINTVKNKNISNINYDSKFVAFTFETTSKDGSNVLTYLWNDMCAEDKTNKLIPKPFTDINLLKKHIQLNPNNQIMVMGMGLLKKLWLNNIDLSNISVYYTHTLLNLYDFKYMHEVKHVYYMNSNNYAELVSTGIPSRKCSNLRLGVNRKLFNPKNNIERDIDIIFVQSYFSKISYKLRKRFDTILTISELFSKLGYKVAILGKNWEEHKNIYNFIHFDCPHSETPVILNRAKIYINAAIHEGGCISLLEGLAMDAYIISCRTGYTNDMKDNIERVSTFSSDTKVDEIIRIINKVLNERLWEKNNPEPIREEFLKESEFALNAEFMASRC